MACCSAMLIWRMPTLRDWYLRSEPIRESHQRVISGHQSVISGNQTVISGHQSVNRRDQWHSAVFSWTKYLSRRAASCAASAAPDIFSISKEA